MPTHCWDGDRGRRVRVECSPRPTQGFLWLRTIEIVHSWTYRLCSFLTSSPFSPSQLVIYMKHPGPCHLVKPPALQRRPRWPSQAHRRKRSSNVFFFFSLHLNVKQLLDVMAGWHPTIPSSFLSSFLCDWINYVSLTFLEVNKHTFSVISHQSTWPRRWKVKHVSQEAGQRGIRPLISGPTQSHHSRLRTEMIPMGYVQCASNLGFVVHADIKVAHRCLSDTEVCPDTQISSRNSKINAFICEYHYFYPISRWNRWNIDGELPEEPGYRFLVTFAAGTVSGYTFLMKVNKSC